MSQSNSTKIIAFEAAQFVALYLNDPFNRKKKTDQVQLFYSLLTIDIISPKFGQSQRATVFAGAQINMSSVFCRAAFFFVIF